MIPNMTTITAADVVATATRMKSSGYRLVTLTALEPDAARMEIIYHFDKDLTMQHFRLTIPREQPVASISGVYFAALLVENEIQDHFGLRFDGLVLDYDQHLYLEEEVGRTPFCKYSVVPKNGAPGRSDDGAPPRPF
jgi:ech hydrogenase subunit D